MVVKRGIVYITKQSSSITPGQKVCVQFNIPFKDLNARKYVYYIRSLTFTIHSVPTLSGTQWTQWK